MHIISDRLQVNTQLLPIYNARTCTRPLNCISKCEIHSDHSNASLHWFHLNSERSKKKNINETKCLEWRGSNIEWKRCMHSHTKRREKKKLQYYKRQFKWHWRSLRSHSLEIPNAEDTKVFDELKHLFFLFYRNSNIRMEMNPSDVLWIDALIFFYFVIVWFYFMISATFA